jgi:predicted nucleotidyltransferase
VFPVNIIHDKAERLGLKYLVIGAHALNAYGTPRATVDVDLLVCKNDRQTWIALLEAEGFKLKDDPGTFLQFSPPYGTEWPLDVMMVNEQTFIKMLNAARTVPVLGIMALVPNAEHLVALKLHALKHGHIKRFDKDMADVIRLIQNAGIEARSAGFRQMVEQFGTAELYEQILKRLETGSGS